MGRKPDLTLVQPDTTGNQPPRSLGKSGTNLWRTLTAHYRFDDIGGIEMLAQLCGADRCSQGIGHSNVMNSRRLIASSEAQDRAEADISSVWKVRPQGHCRPSL